MNDCSNIHAAIHDDNQGGYASLARPYSPPHKKAKDKSNACVKNDEFTLDVLVSGVHCALCIQKIESSLTARENVSQARLNFSSHRLHIQWHGDTSQANDMVKDIEGLGYAVHPDTANGFDKQQDHEARILLSSLGVAGFSMGNIMLLSLGLWITTSQTMGEGTREFLHWIAALIAIPAIIYAGRPFFYSAFQVLRKKHTNMDVPISLALILASGMSLFETINQGEHVYFDSAVMLMFFLLIGRYLDMRARRHARDAAGDLMQGLKGFATLFDPQSNKTSRLLINDLRPDMLVIVAAGEKIPVDGYVQTGQSMIDTSFVTGETLPRSAGPGDMVYAGTINQDAPLTIRVAKAAEDSLLADIVRLMEQAQQGQAQYVRLADRAARLYTPIVHFLAFIAFAFWWGVMGAAWQDALMIAVTVLIITCPCALGLAVPVVQVLATGRLMRAGILVKSGDALERLANIDYAVFDKTGSLTLGAPDLVERQDISAPDISASYAGADLDAIALKMAGQSAHPLSKALSRALADISPLPALDHMADGQIQEISGKGVQWQYGEDLYRLGQVKWCGDGFLGDEQEEGSVNVNVNENALMQVALSLNGQVLRIYHFKDQLREDAGHVISALNKQGVKTALSSGDRQHIVAEIAKQAGITSYFGGQDPVDKTKYIQSLKDHGHNVLMVGDGLNDAPVLASANISMAPGTAVDMAQNICDIIFMGNGLSPVLRAHHMAKRSQSLVRSNFVLAGLYNLVAVPLAFMGFVTPMIAALAMSGSSLVVIANSYRLPNIRKK